MAEFVRLTGKQNRAIAALLAHRTIEEAAKGIGISSRTIYRWLESNGFRQALLQAEGRVVDEAARRLIGGKDVALDTLAELMESAESESVRRQAASNWLEQLIRIRELRNIEKRLSALEEVFHE
jgi:transposase